MKNGFERVQAYKDMMLEEPIRLDVENVKFLQEVYRDEDMGEPAIIKRARLFEKLCDGKTIYIDDSPIVGTMANGPTAVYATPEFASRWILRQFQSGKLRVGLGPVASLSEADQEIMRDAAEFWEKRGAFHRGCAIYDDIYQGEPTLRDQLRYGVSHSLMLDFHLGFVIPDYEKVLTIGLNGIIKEVEEAMLALPVGALESRDKRYFYRAALMTLNAMIRLARRYADLARSMAEKESDASRRQELLKIAEACEHVPANPPRDFYEACQSFWFTLMGVLMETPNSGATAFGRFAHYMYPFYEQDKQAGKITEEEAVTLIGWVFLRGQGYGVFQPDANFKGQQGQTAMHLSIGGVNAAGEDDTNDVDFMVLEAQRRLRLTEPSLTLMWHDKLSEEFLMKCVDLIRTGIGQPQFLNNEKSIERSLYHYPGLTLAEARSVANVACVPTRPSHCCSNLWGGVLNMGKVMELTLNGGKDPKSGKVFAPDIGDAETFGTYEQFEAAAERVIAHRVDRHLMANNISFTVLAEMTPLPFGSCFIDDCIQRGQDIQNGGAKFSTNFIMPVGMVNFGNGMAAIKKLVFEEKKFTLKQLMAALEANFEGEANEEIRKLCLEVPKYGNDDAYVDAIVKHFYDVFIREHASHEDLFGFVTHPEAYSVSTHNLHGMLCGATPDGRKSGMPFTDATVSATPGTDRKGPTALARSASRAIDTLECGSNHFNMKFHPTALEGIDGARNLLSLVKTYMDWGGHHVQFNCVSADTLKKAQAKPEKHKDLVVRVAGFSAFFVHLDKTVQDEIIRRTELKFS